MNFPALLSIMVTLFLLMICGFICRKTNIIDTASSKALSRLIVSVGQPMMIVSALANAEYSAENLTIAWQTTVISFVIHALIALIAYLICRRHNRVDQMKIFEFSLVFANCGFIGFPILDSILGEGKGSFMGAFYVIAFHLFLWTWGIIILARGREDIRMTPKKALLNYGTVPCAIGIALYLLKAVFVLPESVGKFMSYLGNLCTPISVLITGALLATIALPKMLTNAKLYLHSAIKLIAFPVLICLLAKLCGLSETYILMATAMAGVPSAATITMLAELYDIEPGYASQTVGMTSVLSTATLPVVMLFAQWITSL
ncbi:MAG: AEC family transporter [Ruminococcaceae bacterium]|nr:AEC family transporter [Oscillospiraceae bacterium]